MQQQPMEQLKIDNANGVINLTNQAPYYPPPDPGTEASHNVRMSDDLKKWLVDIADAVSTATGDNKYGASTVAREAIQFYREFYHLKNDLRKYKKTVAGIIESLNETLP